MLHRLILPINRVLEESSFRGRCQKLVRSERIITLVKNFWEGWFFLLIWFFTHKGVNTLANLTFICISSIKIVFIFQFLFWGDLEWRIYCKSPFHFFCMFIRISDLFLSGNFVGVSNEDLMSIAFPFSRWLRKRRLRNAVNWNLYLRCIRFLLH